MVKDKKTGQWKDGLSFRNGVLSDLIFRREPIKFNAIQKKIWEKLVDLSPELGKMYMGGLMVLENKEIDYQVGCSMAAHSFREIGRWIAKMTNVPKEVFDNFDKY